MRALIAATCCLAAVLVARSAVASEWGLLVPAQTTQTLVTGSYGAPTRTETVRMDGRDVQEWIYEGSGAPTGMRRLTIDFGVSAADGFHPEVIRQFTLEPNPAIFTLATVVYGWGQPNRVGRKGETDWFFYEEGLVVYFSGGDQSAVMMVFSPPHPSPPDSSSSASEGSLPSKP
jgi:hypothetical protein